MARNVRIEFKSNESVMCLDAERSSLRRLLSLHAEAAKHTLKLPSESTPVAMYLAPQETPQSIQRILLGTL
jgi:hypothetical protein